MVRGEAECWSTAHTDREVYTNMIMAVWKKFCLGAVRPIKVGGTLGHAGRMLATWSLNYSYDCNFIMYFLVAVSVSVSVTV